MVLLTSITDPPKSSLPSPSSEDNDFANKNNNALPRRPKSKVVPSRYLSPSPSNSNCNSTHSMSNSRQFGSPLRSQSASRRRPAVPQADMSAAAKLMITSSRSLSVSFQGETFPLNVSKAKPVSDNSNNNVNPRKATSERRRVVKDQGENSRPVDQHLWPGRTRGESDSSSSGSKDKNGNSLFRSSDGSKCLSDRKKSAGLGSGNSKVVKALQQSMIMANNNSSNRRASFNGRLSLDLGNAGLFKRDGKNSGLSTLVNKSCVGGDMTGSDTDSVSSGSNCGGQESGSSVIGNFKSKIVSRGIAASARFWQETNSRLRRLQDPGSPLMPSSASGTSSGSKFSQSKRLSTDSPMASSRTMASPIRGASSRPASPNRQWNSPGFSPSRGMFSPSRVRPSSGSTSSTSSATASILSFSVGIRRGKVGEDRIFYVHMLRLLYNRYLQWRFINARAESTFEMQRMVAEKYLWNAWVRVSELRHSVTLKRMKLLLLRQKLKLASILKGQIMFLEEWSILDRDQSSSLLGAIEALKASTLRLPLVGKAMADIQNLKNAIGSAVDVMQAMASSICLLSSKVDEMNVLVAELVSVTVKEQLLLDQCRSSMSELTVMQVKDYSLRTHVLQSNCIQTTQILTTRV